jgi:hypothetical protein
VISAQEQLAVLVPPCASALRSFPGSQRSPLFHRRLMIASSNDGLGLRRTGSWGELVPPPARAGVHDHLGRARRPCPAGLTSVTGVLAQTCDGPGNGSSALRSWPCDPVPPKRGPNVSRTATRPASDRRLRIRARRQPPGHPYRRRASDGSAAPSQATSTLAQASFAVGGRLRSLP